VSAVRAIELEIWIDADREAVFDAMTTPRRARRVVGVLEFDLVPVGQGPEHAWMRDKLGSARRERSCASDTPAGLTAHGGSASARRPGE